MNGDRFVLGLIDDIRVVTVHPLIEGLLGFSDVLEATLGTLDQVHQVGCLARGFAPELEGLVCGGAIEGGGGHQDRAGFTPGPPTRCVAGQLAGCAGQFSPHKEVMEVLGAAVRDDWGIRITVRCICHTLLDEFSSAIKMADTLTPFDTCCCNMCAPLHCLVSQTMSTVTMRDSY